MPEQSAETVSESKPQHAPEFDGRNFVISYLSASPNGFEVKTDKTNRRRDAGHPIPLNEDQRHRLKVAMAEQMRFTEGDKAKAALNNLRNTQTDEERETAMQDFQKRRETYRERASPTIGLRNIRYDGETITVDIKPVDFPTYREFGKPDSPPELLDFASSASTSLIVITKDNRLILQHRSPRNKTHAGVPGASASGYLQGVFNPAKNGIFTPIDTDFIKNDSTREANKELGLDKEDFSTLIIAGVAHEKARVHDEFILFARTKLTAEQVKEKAEKASESSKLSTEDFNEKFVDIPANPDTIKTLLTEIKCPIPASHAAAFIAAGYRMMLEQGVQKANEWKDSLRDAVMKNYRQIDIVVEEYYLRNPNALSEVPERHRNLMPRKRNPKGYDSEFLPEEQGLPDLISELKRVSLIS